MAFAEEQQRPAASARPRRRLGARRLADAANPRPWPFQDRLSAGPDASASLIRRGETALIEISGRPLLLTPPDPPQATPRLLALCVAGGALLFRRPDGRLSHLREGELLIWPNAAALDLRADLAVRLVGLSLPAHLLAPRFVSPERLRAGLGHALGGGVARLIGDFLLGLTQPGRAGLSPGALVDAVGGLTAALLEDAWTLRAAAADERPPGSSRLQSVDAYLRRHFADPDLSPVHAAEAIGVSRRYLHRLFTDAGRSFRRDLIALRIEACLKAFADPLQAGKTIAEIAYGAGYTDISQFNRHFRRLHGATPREVRRSLSAPAALAPAPARG
jgi:AraC-like DNA-binding protein